MEVVANYTFADAAGKTLNSGQMVARCSDGNFSMSMGDVATFPTALNMMNADVYMMGDLMNYPDAFSNPMNPGDDDEFDDGTLRLYQKGNKNNRLKSPYSTRICYYRNCKYSCWSILLYESKV